MNISALKLGTSFARMPVKPQGVLSRIANWIAISQERTQLADLDRRMLDDIGMTEAEAMRESARPFWDTTLR
ncbi:MAG: DUF1127 domain-containing protein [Pseudomonadota bacterium]